MKKAKRKREKREKKGTYSRFEISFLERESVTALRGRAYAWTLILRSFDKLREVGVSSYLSFTLCLSVFMMLELIEAMSGRLIGPKS